VLERVPHIPGYVYSLNLKRSKVVNFPRLVISAENNINVSRRAAVRILQTNLCQRGPFRVWFKEEFRSIICDYPFLPKANWTSDNHVAPVENATNAKRILRLVLCAIRDSVVERAKPLLAVLSCIRTHIGRGESKYF
jgi:hypothetical protein